MRALGVDFGLRRIGIAVSDPTGTLATPVETVLRRAGKRAPLAKIEEIARRHAVEQLVMGLPLAPDGSETEWCAEVRDAGDALAARLSVPVAYVDERMTSARAERQIRRMGLPKSRREEKGRVDEAAAALILQAWLDGRSAP